MAGRGKGEEKVAQGSSRRRSQRGDGTATGAGGEDGRVSWHRPGVSLCDPKGLEVGKGYQPAFLRHVRCERHTKRPAVQHTCRDKCRETMPRLIFKTSLSHRKRMEESRAEGSAPGPSLAISR